MYKGKAIYNPSGKAGEYSQWACNFYTGCSNACTYCYCRKGIMAKTWSEKPQLKKCFKDMAHALEVFKKEMKQNLLELQKHGLFFSFTTDPFLTETANLTMKAIRECHNNAIPVKTLSKRGDKALVDYVKLWYDNGAINSHKIAFGFTLTGCDDFEPNSSSNAERIEAMQELHDRGFITWASIEPVIDFHSSKEMIWQTLDFCDLYKIGLLSGAKHDDVSVADFFLDVNEMTKNNKVYWKESVLKHINTDYALPTNSVGRDYNMFNQKLQ